MRISEVYDVDFVEEASELAHHAGVDAELHHCHPDGSEWPFVSALPVQNPEEAVLINEFNARTARQGAGSRALAAVVALADQMGVELVLQPWSGRTPTEVLIGWYRRYGFELGDNGWMYRRPR